MNAVFTCRHTFLLLSALKQSCLPSTYTDWNHSVRDAKSGRPVHPILASPPNMRLWPLASPALMKWVSLPSSSKSCQHIKKTLTSDENKPQPTSLLCSTEECCDLEESPGSLQPSETSSNGAAEDSGSLWGSLGPNTVSVGGGSCQGPGSLSSAVSYQDSIRRCSQRKKSDVLLLGCASLLASVALGQDLLQLGKLQVRGGHSDCY